MLFNLSDIRHIFTSVDYTITCVIAKMLGKNYLNKGDLGLLKSKGVDLKKFIPRFPLHMQAFLFGRVSAAIGKNNALQIKYSDFTKFLGQMAEFNPNPVEMQYYNIAAQKTYTHIKGLGDKIKNTVQTAISSEELHYLSEVQKVKAEKVLHDEILNGMIARKSVKSISSSIATQLDEWDRDWGRIVETECQDIFNLGRAQYIMQKREDAQVYFHVYPGACKHCIRLFMTHGIGSQPRLFTIPELMSNGSNYGLKSKDWKPTLHPIHPYCRCAVTELPEGYVWDKEAGMFTVPKNYKHKVERKSKVKITIGEKEFEV